MNLWLSLHIGISTVNETILRPQTRLVNLQSCLFSVLNLLNPLFFFKCFMFVYNASCVCHNLRYSNLLFFCFVTFCTIISFTLIGFFQEKNVSLYY
ncbi:hypothetical protein UPYG_G00350880 [Umbra pygmaea]|uniref:Uncharacterized protein n=1 Tax=Umbra pygmaea TaxID=75934 RepID=A0ABD0VY49_UMBPY